MKKLLFALGICSTSLLFSQIKIDNSPKPTQIGKITAGQISLEKLNDKYTLCYNDAKFKSSAFKCFSFIEQNNDLENLYNIILKGFDDVPKENIALDLPDDKVELKFSKSMGVVSMQFTQFNKNTGILGYSGYLTKNQVKKLFGRN